MRVPETTGISEVLVGVQLPSEKSMVVGQLSGIKNGNQKSTKLSWTRAGLYEYEARRGKLERRNSSQPNL
jgi:hypothetical protein